MLQYFTMPSKNFSVQAIALLSLLHGSIASMLDDANFERSDWTTFEDPLSAWVSIAPNGTLVQEEGIDSHNYCHGDPSTPGLISRAAHLKANGGNALQQTLHHVDAGTFSAFSIDFQLGYRREVATAGDLTLRVAFVDPSDGTTLTYQDLTVTDPGTGANSLSAQSLTLSVDTASYAGRPIAIRFSNLTDLGAAGWSGTVMIDDIEIEPVTSPVAANTATTTSVRNVINRLLPGRGSEFTFEMIGPDAGRDVFEIEAGPANTVVIRGNRILSLTSGFNWYLKHTADCHVSWNGNQLNLATPAPSPTGIIRQISPYIHRNQGNVTAASYSQAYWNWARWEQEIDRMALNGITQAVVVPGHQKVWQETLLRHGYSQSDIDAYIPNLGHTCWWLFGNLEGDGGPLPQDVIDGEAALGLQIADRMRELGIEPIVFGFVGLVPNTFRDYYPSADIIDQGTWVGYLRPDVLSPLDPQFATSANIWYEELAEVFGEVKFLAGDLFHEGGNSGGINLTNAAAAVQTSMLNALPESTWLIQAWGPNPNSNLLSGTNLHHTIIQQLISDMTTGASDGGTLRTFDGRPWTWNEISNFGGNNGLYGDLELIANLPDLLLAPNNLERFSGLGIFMEAIEVNPIYTDLLTDMFWRTSSPDLNTWLNDLTRRRYGAANSKAEDAWALLRDSVYDVTVFQYGITDFIIGARPGPNVFRARQWGDNTRYWNPWEVTQAAEKMMAAAPTLGSAETFRFDLIDILRQTLNDYTFAVYQKMMTAYSSGNSAQFEVEAARLLNAFDHLDALLATYPQWMIGPWIADARAKSTNVATQELMESNARQIVTTWKQVDEPGLNDYASRSRSGLVGDYYKQRWVIYINDLRDALSGTGNGNYSGVSFELGWRDDRSVSYPNTPSTDTITVASQLWANIGSDIIAEAETLGRWSWSLSNGGATEAISWDVTDLVLEPTRLAVLFDYQSGAHALQIDQVTLERNGNPIAIDTHDGWTGIEDFDHAYSLSFTSDHTPGDTYTLVATVSGSGGGDSNGVIYMTTPGHVSDASFFGRYRRYSVVIGEHDTIDLNADYSLQHYEDGTPTNTYENHTWQQINGLLSIHDSNNNVISYHTLTTPDTLTSDEGFMLRLPVATTVTEWAQSLGLNSPDDAPEADPDNDTFSNTMELALGTDPLTRTQEASAAVFATDGSSLTLNFKRPLLYQTFGFNYTLQQSSTLAPASWTAAPLSNTVVTPHPTDKSLEVVDFTTLTSGKKKFYRLQINND